MIDWTQDFHVDADVRVARTLPGSAFTDQDFLGVEMETIFRRCWLMIPPEETFNDLSENGSQAPVSVLDNPVFLQRDLQGKLHCFPNICTHAWYPLVDKRGTVKTITCSQHGRRFECNGRFASHPGFKDLPGFPSDTDHLQDLPLEKWHQFYFTNLSQPVASLREFTKDASDSTVNMPISRFTQVRHRLETREVEGNWKQHAWNYMDNYHIRFVHKGPEGLAGAIDLASYRTELYRWSSLQWVYARKPEDGFDPALLPSRFRGDPHHRVFALWWFIFPNLALNFYPWGLSVNIYNPVRRNPARTRFQWYHYVLDEEKYERKNETWLDEQVDNEDIEAIANVNKGAQSGLAPRGRFSPTEEIGPHWLHRLIFETISEPITPEKLS